MKRLLLIIPLILLVAMYAGFRTGGYRSGQSIVAGETQFNAKVTFNDASVWMLDDSLFFTDGTAASPGADTSGLIQDGSQFKLFSNNQLVVRIGQADYLIVSSSRIISGTEILIASDAKNFISYGKYLILDSNANDSLSGITFGTTDSLKWDSIPEAATLTCPLTVETITSSGITQFPYVDLDIDDTEEYELTVADGKAGWGMASLEDEWTFFRFTAAGAVTLVNETTNVGTTDGIDHKFNIFDSGTTITFENQLGDNKELNINVWFTP